MADIDEGQDADGTVAQRLSEAAASLFGADGPFAAHIRNMDPKTAMQQWLGMYKTMFEIATGKSEIAADKRDWRFQDDAWKTNPFYRRLLQTYLAMCDAVEHIIPEDLPMEEQARARFAAQIVTSTLAPTNTLLGNPAAIDKTIETRGSNLVRGFKAFVDDLKNNEGLPRQVDETPFEVGVNIAVTPGKVVLRTRMFELIQYAPSTAKTREVPVLLIPPQINRFYFTDLAPDRSFAEYVVSQGLRYFAISWRNPSPEESDFSLEDYALASIEALEAVAAITGQEKVNVVGFCAGGILTALVASHLAATGRDLVNSFTMCVTMLDFKTDAALGAFRLPALLSVVRAQSKMKGVLPGTELGKIFTWMRPNDLVWNYWVNNYLMGEAPPAFDILFWNNDSTNLPARLHQDFLDLFETNLLHEPGKYEIMGQAVDLTGITCDRFVVGAVTDHLTPWKACYLSGRLLGGEGTFALSNGGHVAALVNPPATPKAFHHMAPMSAATPDEWLEGAERHDGSWWESWTKWCAKRSGKLIPAHKTLGSKKFPPLIDAPGEYVKL